MHHFMSTPVPGTSTKCHTLSTALSLFHLSFLSPYNSALCPPPSSLPPSSLPSMMGQNWFSPPLPFLPSLFPLSYSVLSGEADRPHSTGRPRRPFLTRLSVTPLPHPSIPPLQPTNAPPQCSLPLLLPQFPLAVCPISPIPPFPSRTSSFGLLQHLPVTLFHLSIYLSIRKTKRKKRERRTESEKDGDTERETEDRERPVEGFDGWRWL